MKYIKLIMYEEVIVIFQAKENTEEFNHKTKLVEKVLKQ